MITSPYIRISYTPTAASLAPETAVATAIAVGSVLPPLSSSPPRRLLLLYIYTYVLSLSLSPRVSIVRSHT